MRKKLSASLVGAVVCGFFSVCCSVGMVTAYADSYWVSDFVCVPQKKSQWCWAASAEASARPCLKHSYVRKNAQKLLDARRESAGRLSPGKDFRQRRQ